MRNPKSSCPRCNSRQAFPVLTRATTLPIAGVQELYLRCTMCHWEHLLRYATPAGILVDDRKRAAIFRGQRERDRLGTTTRNTRRIILKLVHQSSKLAQELNDLVEQAKDGQGIN